MEVSSSSFQGFFGALLAFEEWASYDLKLVCPKVFVL